MIQIKQGANRSHNFWCSILILIARDIGLRYTRNRLFTLDIFQVSLITLDSFSLDMGCEALKQILESYRTTPYFWVSFIKSIMLCLLFFINHCHNMWRFLFYLKIVLGLRFSVMYDVSHMFCNFTIIIFSRDLPFYHTLIDAVWNLSAEEANYYL